MKSNKINTNNKNANFKSPVEAAIVRGKFYNELKDDFDAVRPSDTVVKADTVSEVTSGAGVTVDGLKFLDGGIQLSTNVWEKTDEVLIPSANILGVAAGDIAHTAGAVLVAGPGSGYALEFVSAVLIYDFLTAAYTGGAGDSLVIRNSTTAVSPAIATADLITAAGDQIVHLRALAADDYDLGAGSTLNLFAGAEITQPGTAAGVIRVHITYRIHTTGL